MEIIVSGRHLSVTDDIKAYAQDKLEAILGEYNKIGNVRVVLDVQKTRCKAEIVVHGKNINVEADAESYEMRESIDAAVAKIDHQVSKHFDKIQDHHKQAKDKAKVKTAGPSEE
ncbi:MAG TPA: ribosome-associated translation inhibitor RaiA [Lentisphaeria bacterium]|nr:MAG: ribosomal subunit interface protein [Lentisphaerae bacterium GWF2_50_93]HCE42282.1 ribosome-associated translation inhibitor RaiA [Lentisphaeria bacterium]